MGTTFRYIVPLAFLAVPIPLGYLAYESALLVFNGYDHHNATRQKSLQKEIYDVKTNPKSTKIVVQLINQLGNNLAAIAAGRGIQLTAQKEYGIETELVLRHSDTSRKWKDTTIELKTCFPNLRHFNFEEGNGPDYDQSLSQQIELLGELHESALHVKRTGSWNINRSLSALGILQSWTNLTNMTDDESSNNIPVPFLLVDAFAMFDVLVDQFYVEFRQLFEFDDEACCKLIPDADESVFHFRNYLTEMPRRGKKLGFEELSPNKTAFELFANLEPGDKVAIATRYDTHPSVQPYVDALVSRGIHVRVITGQTGVQDFCFLMHAQKELVGIAESTYVAWAAHLGNAHKVRLYSVDSPSRRRSPGFFQRLFFHFNWTNPKLLEKTSFELYHTEES